jgi:TP901 family phage tail tape measure protein
MANNPLSILISAKLNSGLALRDLNASIKALAKHPSLQKIDLKISIDKSFISNLSSLSQNLNTITSQLQQQSVANNSVNKGLKDTTQSIQDQTKATNEAIQAEKKWQVEREKTNSKGIKTVTSGNNVDNSKQTVTYLPDGSIKNIDNIKNQLKDMNELKSLTEQMAQGRIASETRVRDFNRQVNENQQKAIQANAEIERTEIAKTQQSRKTYEDWYLKAIKEREIQDSKTYTSLNNKIANGRSSSIVGIQDTKALDLLNRKYSEINQKVASLQSSGRQLTDSELNGINRRIQALNSLATRQRTQERDAASLASTQLRAETQVNNLLSSRHFSNDDTTKLRGLLTQLQQLEVTSNNYKTRARELTDQISKMGSEAQRVSMHAQGLGDKLKQTFSNMLMYSGIGSIFYGAINALKSGIQHIFDIDAAMTDLRKVTDETTSTYNRFLVTANETANAIGGVTVDVVKSTTEWARLGYTIQQAQSLAKQTLVYQNVGDIKSAEDASKSLISTIKGFGIEVDNEGKNITKIVDIYNEVGNKFAISSAGIGEALRRSAASLSEAGNSIEQSVALATAANSTIQDPARVGQMLKTVSMRLRGVSDEGEDLTDLIPSLEKKFAALGLTLKKDDNTFKSTYDIFQDLSSVWSDLSDFQRADILESVAGKLQGNIAASLINNFKDAQDSLNTALNSTGSAARENEKYIQSIAGRMNLFKNAISEFWSKSIESSTVKTIINALTSVVTHIGSVNKALLIAGAAFILFKQKAIVSAIASLYDFIGVLVVTTITTNGTTLALNLLGKAITAGWIGVAAGTFFILYNLINSSSKAIEKQNDLIEKTDKKYSDLNESLSETSNYYKQNYKDISTNNDVKDRMFQLQSQLIDSFGLEAKGLDLVNGKYEDQIAKLEELSKKKLADELKDNQIVVNSINETRYSKPQLGAKLIGDGYSVQDGGGQGTDLSLKEYYEELLVVQDKIRNGNTDIYASEKLIPNTWKEKELALNAVSDQMAKLEPSYKKILNYEDLQKESQKEQELRLVKLNDEQKKFFDDVNNIASKQSFEDYGKYIQGLAGYAEWFTGDNATSLINQIEKIPQIKADPDTLKSFENLKQGYIDAAKAAEGASEVLTMHDALIALDKGLNGSSEQLNKFVKYITTSKDNVDELNKAQKELDDNGQLSAQTIKDLNDKYGDFIKKTGLSKDGIYKYIKAIKDQENTAIGADINTTQKAIANSEERLKQLKKEYDILVDILNAKIDNATVEDLNAEKIFLQQTAPYRAAQEELSLLKTKYSILTQTQNDYNTIADDSKSSTDKLNDSYSDTIEILTGLQKQLKNVQKLQEEEENKRKRMRQSSKEYQDSLKKTIDLKKQELALLEKGSKNPSQLVSTKVTSTTKTTSESSVNTATSSFIGSGSNGSYSDIINKYASTNNVDSNLIKAIIAQESSFNSKATSSAGAKGLMQLMDGTARGLGVTNSYDPDQNIAGGTKYFAGLLKKYNGDTELALMAYNGGPGRIDKWLKSGKDISALPKETQQYASKVLGYYNSYNGSSSSPISSSSNGKTKTINKSENATVEVKTDGPTAKEIADAADKNRQDILNTQNEIYDAQVKYLEEIKYLADLQVEEQERLIAASQKRQEKLDPTSKEFQKENQVQVNIRSKIQGIKNQESLDLQKAIKEYGIESDEYDELIKQLQTERMDLQSGKYQKLVENINIGIEATKEGISELDRQLSLSEQAMSQLVEGTPEYNQELNKQLDLKKKQKEQNTQLVSSIQNLIKSEALDTATKKNLKSVLDDLLSTDYTTQIKELNNVLVNSTRIPLEKKLSGLNYQLEISEGKLKGFTDGSREYIAEISNQVAIIKQKIAATRELIAFEEIQSKNEALTASAREEHKQKLQEYTLSLYDYSDSIRSLKESYADKVIEDYKNLLQEQQKLQKAAYDKEKELENKRHETKMDNLDDELSAFQDIINAQTKSLDREVAEEDYQDQLAKLQKEKSELEVSYSKWIMDDSLEAKSKRADLEKEIAAKSEEITKLQRDREITIRKDGLTDQLEDRQNAIDKEKKLEDSKHDVIIDNLEELEKLNDEYYEGLLNDEQYFYNMKQALMSDDTVRIQNEITKIQSAYTAFYQELEKNFGIYSEKIASNLKYAFSLNEENLKNYPFLSDDSTGSSNPSDSTTSTPSSGSSSSNSVSEKDTAWKDYLTNKQKAEQLKTDMKTLLTDSADYKNKQAQFEKLKAANDVYRSKYGFPDGSYADLNKLTKYHTGGIVGEKGTTTKSLLEDVEVPAILKKSEGIIDKPRDFFKEIAGNVMSNLSNMLSNFNVSQIFKSPLQPQSVDNSLSVHIDNVTGDKQGAKVVTDAIEDLWKRKTKSGW